GTPCDTRADLALADSGLSTAPGAERARAGRTPYWRPRGPGATYWRARAAARPASARAPSSQGSRGPGRDAHGGTMAKTLIRIFLDTVAQQPKPALFMRRVGDIAGKGRWESLSSERARKDVEGLALGLAGLGVRRGDRVALLSENRYEWAITDLATLGQGAVTVPIYPTLTAPQSLHILENSEARIVVVSNAAQLEKVLAVAGQLPRLAAIVTMDPPPPSRDARVRAWAEVLADGERRRAAEPNAFQALAEATRPGDLATIIYTSGTT